MNFIEYEPVKNWAPRALLRLLFISLLLKLAYLIFTLFILPESSGFTFDGYFKMAQRNDSGWYRLIAENWYPEVTDRDDLGYSHGAEYRQSEWAFFPFYPGINRVLMQLTGASFDVTGFIYSIVFSTLAVFGFYWFSLNFTRDNKKSFFFALLFMLYPFHYYYSMMYTEAVYFTFLVCSFIVIFYRKYIYLPLVIIPLVLVRPNGIIALVPLYLYFLERNEILSKKIFHFDLLFSRRIVLQSMLFLAGPAAFILYGFYQEHMTGYFNAFSIAQAGWYREFMWPFMSFFRRGDITTQFNSVYTLLFIALAVIAWKKFPLSLNILVWTGLLLPLFSGSVTSMPRFISVIFPFIFLLGDWMYNLRARYYVIGSLAILQFVVFYFCLIGHPFSC